MLHFSFAVVQQSARATVPRTLFLAESISIFADWCCCHFHCYSISRPWPKQGCVSDYVTHVMTTTVVASVELHGINLCRQWFQRVYVSSSPVRQHPQAGAPQRQPCHVQAGIHCILGCQGGRQSARLAHHCLHPHRSDVCLLSWPLGGMHCLLSLPTEFWIGF